MNIEQRLPEGFVEKLTELVPDEQKRAAILATFSHKKPLSIRVNTIKSSVQQIESILNSYGLTSIHVYWYPNALIISKGETAQLTSLDAYRQGLFYIQNLSSMIPALALDPKPGEKILDMCAAPGSKTSQMAMMMMNTGEILANDKSRNRLYKLDAICKQLGVTNVRKSTLPGEILWKRYPNYFDKTLVDVPCSMEGRFDMSDTASYKDWTPKKVKVLSHMQKWLLRSAITATKPGGTIVYSTCTLSPEENEEVIDWLLKTEPYPLAVEKIEIPNLPADQPITRWKNKPFDKQIANTLRILPTQTMEAFFVAKILKQ